MAIQILNSLTRKKEKFIPISGKTVNIYCCGVTVYDQCHIGHARSLYVFHLIRKYLEFRGFDVHFVRNITDIDDKIINKANELNKLSSEVSENNIKAYYQDLKLLGVEVADIEPKATDNIKEMVVHIEGLIEKGFAYEADGHVYFSVRAFKPYGRLSGQSIDKMQEAVRIDQDSHKKDPLDFALWKKSGENEPSWESPWSKGRPGWHIECSCMSMKHLKTQTLDIHAGGRDLIFPHHENEIAQSEALTGKPFAKYWIHHGLLTINNQKMAKSLGNFITIADALEKYSADQLKMFFLSSHYASAVDFSEEKMVESKKQLQRIEILLQKVVKIVDGEKNKEQKIPEFVKKFENSFIESMDDDFNTAKGLGVVFEFVNELNKYIDSEKESSQYAIVVGCAGNKLKMICQEIFGIFREDNKNQKVSSEVEFLLVQRMEARQIKDYAASDQLRDELKEIGILVEDGPDGQTWRRV